MEKMKLGDWLQRERTAVGTSIKDFAKDVGCSVTTIKSIERGYPNGPERLPYHPARKLMTAIAGELGYSLDVVYHDTDWRDDAKRKASFGFKAPKTRGQGKRTKTKKEAVQEVAAESLPIQGPTRSEYIIELQNEIQAFKDWKDAMRIDTLLEDRDKLEQENERLKYYIKQQLRKDMDTLIDEQINQIITGNYGYKT